MTATVDTSVLQKSIPGVVKTGYRTLREQCITSAGLICLDAMELTPHATISGIDAEMEKDRTPPRVIRKGSEASRKFRQNLAPLPWDEAMMLVRQRMHADSPYNKATGNRWQLPGRTGLKGAAYWRFIRNVADRMVKAKHSSTHFLRSGWKPAVAKLLGDPDYLGNAQKQSLRNASRINPLNTLPTDSFGLATISEGTNAITVTAENNVGEGSTGPLNAEHRRALIEYGLPALDAAVEYEGRQMMQWLEKRLGERFKQEFSELL